MGVVHIKSGEIDTSFEEYKRALALYPNNPKNYLIHFNIALAHLKNKGSHNRLESATEHLEKALAINPKYDKAIELLQKVRSVGSAA